MIKQKRDALANDDSGIVRPPKNFAVCILGGIRREGNAVNFPKTDHMPDVLYGDQRPPPIPDKKCCYYGQGGALQVSQDGTCRITTSRPSRNCDGGNGLSDGPLRTNTVKDYELVDADDRINREKRHPAELPQRPPVEATPPTRGRASAFNNRLFSAVVLLLRLRSRRRCRVA